MQAHLAIAGAALAVVSAFIWGAMWLSREAGTIPSFILGAFFVIGMTLLLAGLF